MRYQPAHGVVLEQVGDGWVVLGAVPGVMHRLDGDAAGVLSHVMGGTPVPEGLEVAAGALVHAGILVDARIPVAPVGGMSRRRVLGVGAVGAGVGLATLVLPQAAAAASPPGPGPEPGDELVTNGSFEDGTPGLNIPGWQVGV